MLQVDEAFTSEGSKVINPSFKMDVYSTITLCLPNFHNHMLDFSQMNLKPRFSYFLCVTLGDLQFH